MQQSLESSTAYTQPQPVQTTLFPEAASCEPATTYPQPQPQPLSTLTQAKNLQLAQNTPTPPQIMAPQQLQPTTEQTAFVATPSPTLLPPNPFADNYNAPQLPPNPFGDLSTPTVVSQESQPKVNQSKFDAYLEHYIDAAERYLSRGPSSHKATLKRSIWQLSLEVYELSIQCQKKIATKTTLNALNAKHELLRRLWARLYKQKGLDYNTARGKLSNPHHGLRRYRFINEKLNDVGIAVGTWYKQLIRKCNH